MNEQKINKQHIIFVLFVFIYWLKPVSLPLLFLADTQQKDTTFYHRNTLVLASLYSIVAR